MFFYFHFLKIAKFTIKFILNVGLAREIIISIFEKKKCMWSIDSLVSNKIKHERSYFLLMSIPRFTNVAIWDEATCHMLDARLEVPTFTFDVAIPFIALE